MRPSFFFLGLKSNLSSRKPEWTQQFLRPIFFVRKSMKYFSYKLLHSKIFNSVFTSNLIQLTVQYFWSSLGLSKQLGTSSFKDTWMSVIHLQKQFPLFTSLTFKKKGFKKAYFKLHNKINYVEKRERENKSCSTTWLSSCFQNANQSSLQEAYTGKPRYYTTVHIS